ncbi:MAG: precorrin-2 C(20)-methyltransferase [Andreesenia angusta]|nr:precorrin-2 C(20)-methyltransferase [Andreesenia angusta]
MNRFYGIGVGPGDPELLTLKAIRILKEAEYLFIPKSKDNSMAKNIVSEYIKDREIIELEFPMGEDNSNRYREAAKDIEEKLLKGNAAFITLGDPMTYSTYIYLYRELKTLGIKVETIPGINAYSASASRLNIPLAIKSESIYITDSIPPKAVLDEVETVCIFKCNRRKKEIIEILREKKFKFYLIKRVSHIDEEIISDIDEMLKIDDYMSIIIGRK